MHAGMHVCTHARIPCIHACMHDHACMHACTHTHAHNVSTPIYLYLQWFTQGSLGWDTLHHPSLGSCAAHCRGQFDETANDWSVVRLTLPAVKFLPHVVLCLDGHWVDSTNMGILRDLTIFYQPSSLTQHCSRGLTSVRGVGKEALQTLPLPLQDPQEWDCSQILVVGIVDRLLPTLYYETVAKGRIANYNKWIYFPNLPDMNNPGVNIALRLTWPTFPKPYGSHSAFQRTRCPGTQETAWRVIVQG